MRNRRVLALVTDAYGGYGGIAAYNRDVFQALSEHPRIARTVAVPRVATFTPGALPDRVEFRTWSMGGVPRFVAAALVETLRLRPHLIHCAHINHAPIAAALGRMLGVPWSLSLYGSDSWQRTGRPLVDRAIAEADLLLPISTVTEERFRSAFPQVSAPYRLMPNALHSEMFGLRARNPQLVERYGTAGRKVVMTMARLGADHLPKGFQRMFAALPQIARRVPNLLYLICGDGSHRGLIERRCAELGLADRVRFTGYVAEAEKADHYRLADAFAMPSSGEGFGFVFTEAMACGVPVVATEAGGIAELVEDGVTGHLVPVGDVQAMADRTLQLFETPSAGEAARQRAVDRFDTATIVPRYEALYERVLSTRRMADHA